VLRTFNRLWSIDALVIVALSTERRIGTKEMTTYAIAFNDQRTRTHVKNS
jgi:hypothetical protein